jgi:acyl carrier protein|tara:strand:- start:476 stop:721 length:246 start_codon:yes stop_codon:yes gene_type:complete
MEKNKNKKLFSILAKILNVKLNKINLRTNSKNLDEWDSLASLNIITFLEKKFRNKINKLDVKDTTSARSIIKLLKKNKIKI